MRTLTTILFSVLVLFSSIALAQEQIDINKADAKEIATLANIGEKKAQEIVDYREKNGSFKTIDELTNVKGIGRATIEKNRDLIAVTQ